ncbi:Tfp pilus assembly protein PilX [Microbacterium sp. W4I4]|uniref:hypothetical protein n=1 Tax=Microbacterium sp. W4I4 TaxID=3042295 RepID=UPI0027860EA9|nr:hypothetical protein [Microbacterium sp. W4I4]MDQ0614917.1 Tfp pilus assembly protein PilX [Microbacterium sp. W4I4]
MLVTRRLMGRADSNDAGAALVAVIIIMVVGMIAAATIAAGVVFAMSSNASNKATTQAFVAAESGRDAALDAVVASSCSLTASNSDPAHGPVFYATAQTGPDEANLSAACPTDSISSVIEITSTGWGSDGSMTTVKALYQRPITFQNQPGGTLAYFAGQFKLTQSTFDGDLVIREGNYECNSTTTINGDLWVPKGNLELSSSCEVTGNVYALGLVEAKGSGTTIGGNIVSEGSIILGSTDGTVGGDVNAGVNITVKGMTVAGSATAGGSVTVDSGVITGGYKVTTPLPVGAITPSLQAVYDMTTWVDFPSTRDSWGTDVDWKNGTCSGNAFTDATRSPAPGKNRLGIDYTLCTGTISISVTGATSIGRDVIFLFPPNAKMDLTLGTLIGATPKPQLLFIHADNVPDRQVTCSTSVGSGGDALESVANDSVKILLYTPCGLFKAPKKEGFHGQYYSGDSGSGKLEQPDFVCAPMTWEPRLDLGCRLSDGASGSGDVVRTRLAPTLISQTEVPLPAPSPTPFGTWAPTS